MFYQLTKYLVQYNNVSIPEIGSFKLLQQPARLDVAEKLVYPPSYSLLHDHNDHVGYHQSQHLFEFNNDGAGSDQLIQFGKGFRKSLTLNKFSWSGMGVFENGEIGPISFQPNEILIDGLQPIVANKVLRENVQHTVLVGENEVLKGGILDEIVAPANRKKVAVIAGWILAALAAAFIIFYLYNQGFQSPASGTTMKAVPASAK